MKTDIGEYVVGAYLKLELGCDVVDYNARQPGGGRNGQNEFDVVGYNLSENKVYICEVATHIRGLAYGDGNEATIRKISVKHDLQKKYAESRLAKFQVKYQFWSPYVPKGYLTENLAKIGSLDLIINEDYRNCIEQLRTRARKEKHDAVNPFFRMLQIMEAMRTASD